MAGRKGVDDVTFPVAIGIGAAQALALVPGISRSGISISAGRFAGLDREAAARFSFLMATPDHRRRGPVRGPTSSSTGEAGVEVGVVPLIVGMSPHSCRGSIAIDVLLALPAHALARYVRRRIASSLAAVVVVVWLAR